MSKVNSFTETVNTLIEQVNIGMANVVALNESITTQNDTINLTVEQKNAITGDPSTVTYAMPSYNTVINKVNSLEQTMDSFVKGEGVVLLADGTYRKVTTQPVAISPVEIQNISIPTNFYVRSNWFFESMMFPQLIVTFDLKGKIDDRSDRVVVKRVIFDNQTDEDTQWFLDNVTNVNRSYYETVTYYNEQGKRYWEDEETIDLPLKVEPYTGYFVIVDKLTINGKEWFYLDTMNYGETTDSPIVKNYQLAIGDQLRYGNSIWQIDAIQINENRIHIIPMVGMDQPTISKSFEIYTSPFSTKLLDIPIGYDECNSIFIKGVNDDFNVIGDNWSSGISFWTNDLILDGGSMNLEDYYNANVADFGKQLEGQAKEKFIPAYFGLAPDAPVFTSDNFSVKQLNTQLNAALDIESVKNTQTQIESTKTFINSLKTTIAQQKAQLVELTDPGERASLNSKIIANINDLSKKTIEYQSLVRSLATVAYENSAVTTSPKYRIRGFFSIPAPKGNPPQEIIQFEYAYRYIKLDNSGTSLNTYEYNDPSTGQKIKGTFTDWNIVSTSVKQKVFDSSTETYSWITENIADGEINNINQVDIAITKGEKVQLKIRSISEAGWPLNPLKSSWSDPIILEFPSNIEGSNQITNILSDAASEIETIKLDETLSAAGVPTHIADSIPNPNSGNGTYFKHQAVNLVYDLKIKDIDGVVSSVKSTDLQSQIENLSPYTYITLTKPTGAISGYNQLTGTLQQFLQAIVNVDPSIYESFEDQINPV
jgi:hypothetical protein